VQLSFPYSVHKIYFCLLLSVWFNFDAGQDIRCFKLCTLGIVLFVNFLIYRVSEPYDKNRADVLPRHRIPFTVPSIVKWHNNMSIHVTGVETGKYHQGKHILHIETGKYHQGKHILHIPLQRLRRPQTPCRWIFKALMLSEL